MKVGDKYLGLTIAEIYNFSVEGTFESYYEASRFVKDMGYEKGSMDGFNPIALLKDFDYIAKWHNLSKKDKTLIQGVMISDYFREKPVTVLIFKENQNDPT